MHFYMKHYILPGSDVEFNSEQSFSKRYIFVHLWLEHV